MTEKQRQQFNKMRHALTKIYKHYQTPEQLRRNCEKSYGLGFEESLEMAYENLQAEARYAVKGVKELKSSKPKGDKKVTGAPIVLTIALLLVTIFSYGQMTDGSRDSRVTAFERKIFPSYGTCLKCGRPWNCCRSHVVRYSEREGVFALCEDCWDDCGRESRKIYYAMLYAKQVAQGMKDDHLGILMKAVEADSTKKSHR